MNAAQLKDAIRDRIWAVADRHPFIRSATLTGSFIEAASLDGIGDIDCVVVVDRLNAERYATLFDDFDAALRGLLAAAGYEFRINPTLGPLKFNGPKLAILHLMLYSEAARVEHAHLSPFTCLDWQRSAVYRKEKLADVYPVFGLQPRHVLGARRSVADYLRDLHAGVVSYRELVCDAGGYAERTHGKPMTVRDRHEFAYHVMRFLMSNLLKLITRANEVPPNERLLEDFFTMFPEGAGAFVSFFQALAARKKAIDFDDSIPDLEATLENFALALERQFRKRFEQDAKHHVVFRHAPTRLNGGTGDAVVFQGRTDEAPVATTNADWELLAEVVRGVAPEAAFASPAVRARQSLALLSDAPVPEVDDRLHEIDYGALEGLTVAAARRAHPEVFAAWDRGEDPRLPGPGESVADVLDRATAFARDRWAAGGGNTVACTHNVVMRCLIGSTLGVPRGQWHRLRVPHLAPVTFVMTRDHGLFVNIPEPVERQLFAGWAEPALPRAA